jgi:DNA topoisomerase I
VTILVIVESPAKGKTIEGYLGSQYRVSASVGHIRDLPETGLGVYPPDFKPEYVLTEKGKDVVARLKRLASECDSIILASDLDTEGEAIAWHLKQVLGIKNEQRIVFNEITKSAIQAALANPRPVNLKLVAAQETRRVTDRLVGYLVSPVIAETLGDRHASVGRVQSVAIRLVVDREDEINGHSVVNHFGAKINFNGWSAEWLSKPFLDGADYWTDSAFAEKVAATRNVKVISCAESVSKSSPPAPFTTSTLQSAGSNALGFSPKRTMELAQKLYEQGAITYMRTDSTNLSAYALDEIKGYCKANNLPVLDVPRSWKAKADVQGAHEAVRPSHINTTSAGEGEDEQKLYRLIWLRTVGCQLEEARFDIRTVTLEAAETIDGKMPRFEARSKKLTYLGWKALTPVDSAEDPDKGAAEDNEDSHNKVPMLAEGDHLVAEAGELTQSKTNPPARYTEASLVKDLEKKGIGRPSTYGATIEGITVTKNYVEVFGKKKQLKPTARGDRLIKVLKGNFKFLEYDFTRILEQQLEGVASGKTPYKGLVALIHDRLVGEIKEFKQNNPVQYPCPKCGRGLILNPGKKKKDAAWWGCSGYKSEDEAEGCDYMAADDSGKPGKSTRPQLTEHSCGTCSKPLILRVKEGADAWQFFGCSGRKDGCNQSYPEKDGEPDYSSPRIKKAAST